MGEIKNFNSYNRKNDIKILVWIVLGFLLVVWLCTPPGNKFLQVCFWGHNVQYAVAKITNPDETKEYIFHRNNAVYLAKMDMKKDAIREMDRAIQACPVYISEKELQDLYRDRAYIRLYAGDHQGALSDFCNSGDIKFNDNLTVAMLFKENGNYQEAISYCNSILQYDYNAFAGYACLAEIYQTFNRTDLAIRIWQLAITRKENNASAYLALAKLYKSIGDNDKYTENYKKAKEYNALINEKYSIIDEALNPKYLNLAIKS